MAIRRYTVAEYSPTLYPTDIGYWVLPHKVSATTKPLIITHGRTGTGYGAGVGATIEPYVTALVVAGFACLAIDHARINSWGDPDAMRAMIEASDRITAKGFTSAKLGIFGASMGGATALNFAKRYPSRTACMWLHNAVTDTRFFRDASGSYTPTYSTSPASATQGIWGPTGTNEIDGTFAPSTAATAGATIPALGGTGVTVSITTNSGKSFNDGHNQGVVGKPQATVAGVAFTYTSKTDSSLVGCISTTASPITVASSAAITTTYAQQSPGYIPWNEAASWAGLGVKTVIAQASDDTTVPPAMNANDATGFVGKVNHADVTLRSPSPTGGHLMGVASIPASEVVSFFTTYHV